MYKNLGILAAILGLLLVCGAIYTIISIIWQRKKLQNGQSFSQSIGSYLLRWSFFDYAIIVVFFSGMLFLLTEVIAVMKEPKSFPYYHYGYLLSGFVFSMLGMLFMIFRFAVVLRMVRGLQHSALINNQDEPYEADTSK